MAEGVGFEPTVGDKPTPVFKTGALDHSATPPQGRVWRAYDERPVPYRDDSVARTRWRRRAYPERHGVQTGGFAIR